MKEKFHINEIFNFPYVIGNKFSIITCHEYDIYISDYNKRIIIKFIF